MSCIPINDFSLISLCDATKAGKLYSIVPDDGSGDFDVARNSTATYVGADGLIKTAAIDEPRIEFNPDGSYKGLLVEPQRTNLLLRSEEFDDGAWPKSGATITANVATAPNGTMTADKIVENTASSAHNINSPNVNVTSGASYTASIFAKESERRFIFLALSYSAFTSGNGVCFDLQTGTIVATGTGSLNAGTITNFGNGWYRCTITLIATSTLLANALPAVFIANVATSSIPSYTGDGTSGVLLWGAQAEEASTASSYIPTVASTVTRVADVVSKTGASALIGQTEGTIYVEVDLSNSFSKHLLVIDNGLAQDFISLFRAPNNRVSLGLRKNFVSVSAILSSVIPSQGVFKIAVSYESGNQVMFINGNLAGTGTNSSTFPTLTLSRIVLASSPYNNTNDHIKAVALLPTRLSNAELEALTS